jgi:Tfp pilus assembly protein PilF
MGRTLNLFDRLLERGRHLQAIGRTRDALAIFSRLASFKELPTAVAEEASARSAEIQLGQRKYQSARRHLAAVISHQPGNPRYHFMMANALDVDEDGDVVRAYEHYRKSLELDANQPRCLSDFGLLALCLGNLEEGLHALRKAAELAPDDPEIVAQLVEGLCDQHQADEARKVLRAARFRNSRDPRFLKLWNDFQFQQLREAQEAARRTERYPDAANARMILPFIRPAPGDTTALPARKKFRRDGASFPNPPHPRRRSHLPDRKHA